MMKEQKKHTLLKATKGKMVRAFLFASAPLAVFSLLSFGNAKKSSSTGNYTPLMSVVSFTVDTLMIDQNNYNKAHTVAFYNPSTDTITSVWLQPDSSSLTPQQLQKAKERAEFLNHGYRKLSSFLHENRHKYNKKIYKKLELKNYHKAVAFLRARHQAEYPMHDEITANITQLFYARDLFRQGMPLDDIPLPANSEAYKEFLKNHPHLNDRISPEELAVLAQKSQEWVDTYRDYYAVVHGINIAKYQSKNKKKVYPSIAVSTTRFNQLLEQIYTFHYHGQIIKVPFHRIDLAPVVEKVVRGDTQILDSLINIQKDKISHQKGGNGKLCKSPLLPNYNPIIIARQK